MQCTDSSTRTVVWGGIEPPEYLTSVFGKKAGVTISSFPAMVWPGYIVEESESFSCSQLVMKSALPNYCSSCSETLTVLATGDMVPCCYDIVGENVFGNVNELSFDRIAKGEKRLTFLKQISEMNPPDICKRCSMYAKCYLSYKEEFQSRFNENTNKELIV